MAVVFVPRPSLNKHLSLVLRSQNKHLVKRAGGLGANHRSRLFSDTVCCTSTSVWLSCIIWMELPFHHLGIGTKWALLLNFRIAIKAVLATKKLGEHLRRDAQHMRVTGAWPGQTGPPTSQRADGPTTTSSTAQWDAVGAAAPRGPLCATTKTRQPSPTKALYSTSTARAFTREKRQKLGDGGVAALVEKSWRGDWCLEDLSFYSFCSDPPFWAAANPSFASQRLRAVGRKAKRQLLKKVGKTGRF